jgi:hypothetical protein
LAALLVLVPTAAAGTLDQSEPVINTNATVFVSDEIPEAQTFTVEAFLRTVAAPLVEAGSCPS